MSLQIQEAHICRPNQHSHFHGWKQRQFQDILEHATKHVYMFCRQRCFTGILFSFWCFYVVSRGTSRVIKTGNCRRYWSLVTSISIFKCTRYTASQVHVQAIHCAPAVLHWSSLFDLSWRVMVKFVRNIQCVTMASGSRQHLKLNSELTGFKPLSANW